MGRPCLPRVEGLGRQALRERMMAKGGLHSFQGLLKADFPAGTTCAGHLVLPGIHLRRDTQ